MRLPFWLSETTGDSGPIGLHDAVIIIIFGRNQMAPLSDHCHFIYFLVSFIKLNRGQLSCDLLLSIISKLSWCIICFYFHCFLDILVYHLLLLQTNILPSTHWNFINHFRMRSWSWIESPTPVSSTGINSLWPQCQKLW